MFGIFGKRKKAVVKSTPFSEFVRTASSSKKKRVYVKALKRASDDQKKIVEKHGARRSDRECLST